MKPNYWADSRAFQRVNRIALQNAQWKRQRVKELSDIIFRRILQEGDGSFSAGLCKIAEANSDLEHLCPKVTDAINVEFEEIASTFWEDYTE